MAETEMKQKVAKGLFWKLLENGGAGSAVCDCHFAGAASDPGRIWCSGNYYDFHYDCKCICTERLFYGSGAENGRQMRWIFPLSAILNWQQRLECTVFCMERRHR